MVSTIIIWVIYYIFTCYFYGCKSGPLIYRKIHSSWCFKIYQSEFLPYQNIWIYAGGGNKRMEQPA